MRIGVIVNARAALPARDPALADRLARIVGDDGAVRVTRSALELPAACDELLARGSDLVALCGGDGTYLATLTELVRRTGGGDRMPRIALLRGGTVNTAAENLGLRERPADMLERIVARRRAGEAIIESGHDLLEVNGRFGFLFGAAMGARFIEAYYRGRSPGLPRAVALWVRTVVSSAVQGPFARRLFEPVACEIVADGAVVPVTAARIIVASVIPNVGIGMRVAWRAGGQPQRFHLVTSSLSTTSMFLQLGRVLRGRPLTGEPHDDRLARHAVVRFREPQVYTVDGELFRDERIELRVGPRVWVVRG